MFTKQTITTATATLLATAGLAAATAPAASAGTRYAHTPSGNITCKASGSSRNVSLTCSIRDARRSFKITTAGTAYETSYRSIARRGQVFEYDQAYGLGSLTCASSTEGLACMDDDTEQGFFISREGSGIL